MEKEGKGRMKRKLLVAFKGHQKKKTTILGSSDLRQNRLGVGLKEKVGR